MTHKLKTSFAKHWSESARGGDAFSPQCIRHSRSFFGIPKLIVCLDCELLGN